MVSVVFASEMLVYKTAIFVRSLGGWGGLRYVAVVSAHMREREKSRKNLVKGAWMECDNYPLFDSVTLRFDVREP